METSPKEMVPEPMEWGAMAVRLCTVPPGPLCSKSPMATAPDRGEPPAKGRGIVPGPLGGERPPPLEAYRKKRDPDPTPAPFGWRPPAGGGPLVGHAHRPRRPHHDLPLEMAVVLSSSARPQT